MSFLIRMEPFRQLTDQPTDSFTLLSRICGIVHEGFRSIKYSDSHHARKMRIEGVSLSHELRESTSFFQPSTEITIN
jgi:hypothetical protein